MHLVIINFDKNCTARYGVRPFFLSPPSVVLTNSLFMRLRARELNEYSFFYRLIVIHISVISEVLSRCSLGEGVFSSFFFLFFLHTYV